MSKRDYYEVLGIERDADLAGVKASYRQAALKWHPDRNQGEPEAETRFKEAAEAYSVLSDAEKRARYDRFGHAAAAGGGFDPTVFSDFSDILGDLFGFGDLFGGGRRGGRRVVAGADLRYDLTLTFEEAAFGTEPTLRVPRLETCGECGGSGSAGDRPPENCEGCQGRGQVRYSQGFFTVARTCPRCGGAGTLVRDPCAACGGQGRTQHERSLQVRIPAGVDSGARLRLSGEGEHGQRGGPPGDLYVVIQVEEHPRFVRQGADVASVEDIHYAQAVLGTTIEAKTVHGAATVDVPPGTVSGAQFVIRGKGLPRLGRRGQGDHVVEVRIEVPKPSELSTGELDLLRRLAEMADREVKEKGVLGRVKDLFA